MNKNKPQDDKLIKDLYAKLDWFTFEAREDEFDPEQVQAILNLLDTLDPMKEKHISQTDEGEKDGSGEEPVWACDPDAAFERFKKKYGITEEDLAKKNGKDVPKMDTAEKIVAFPAEFSAELVQDATEVRALTGQAVGAENGVSPVAEVSAADTSSTDALPKRRHFLSSVQGKVAVAVIVVLVMGTGLTMGTSAVKQKSFFETVHRGLNSMRITVTGNISDTEEISYEDNTRIIYDSWEEILEENNEILFPDYIPKGLELEILYKRNNNNYVTYEGIYKNGDEQVLRFKVDYFDGSYTEIGIVDEESWEFLYKDDKNISYYQMNENFRALWNKGKCLYTVVWNNLDEIEEIIDSVSK